MHGESAETSTSADGRPVAESVAEGIPAGQLWIPEHFPSQPPPLTTTTPIKPSSKLDKFIVLAYPSPADREGQRLAGAKPGQTV